MKQVERLDKSHKAILQYIKKYPKSTQNQIQQAMFEQKTCSRMTTLRKLNELIDMEEIKDMLKKGDSGFHRYDINDKESEFNRINRQLVQIEQLVRVYRNDIPNLDKLILREKEEKGADKSSLNRTRVKLDDIKAGCMIGLQVILENLLLLTNSTIASQKDSQILFTKIVKLLMIIIQGSLYTRESRGMLDHSIDLIKHGQNSDEYKAYIQNKNISIDLKTFISFIENFSKEFLSK